MTFAHTRFYLLSCEGTHARYQIVSPDFSGTDEILGELELDIADSTFFVHPGPSWIRDRIVPPHLLALDPETYRAVMETNFRGYACGTNARHVLNFAQCVFETRIFPESAHRAS